jgi:methylase of polypeptide subunit release factors
LPYIPEETFEQNVADNVKKREPKPAFVGGDDGLDYYRIMLDQLIDLYPKNLVMFLEMMTWQVDILRQLYDDKFIFEEVKTFHFNIRIVKAYLK